MIVLPKDVVITVEGAVVTAAAAAAVEVVVADGCIVLEAAELGVAAREDSSELSW